MVGFVFWLMPMDTRPLPAATLQYLQSFAGIVVTGGSSGIGRALLRRIEESNPRAVVCNVSRTLPADWPSLANWHHLPTDLAEPAAIEAVAATLQKLIGGEGTILLVNNSGFGAYGPFPTPGIGHHLRMIDVNTRAPVHLTALLWPELLKRGGRVINVASVAGYQPVPLMATYAATKAFLLNWSIALDEEGKTHGVRCTAICPGPVATQFFRAAGFSKPTGLPGQTAEACVDEMLAAMVADAPERVTGLSNRLLSVLAARLPKAWAAAVGRRLIERKLGSSAH